MHEHDTFDSQDHRLRIEVHRELGPGLVEPTYERALCLEFTAASLHYMRQVAVPVLYKGH